MGSDVLVVGAGPIGVLARNVARASGACRVFGVEPLQQRRATAFRSGAAAVWSPEEAADAVLDATHGRGVDAVIMLAGDNAAIEIAVAAARPGARISLGGIASKDSSSFVASAASRKGLTFAIIRRMNDAHPPRDRPRDDCH